MCFRLDTSPFLASLLLIAPYRWTNHEFTLQAGILMPDCLGNAHAIIVAEVSWSYLIADAPNRKAEVERGRDATGIDLFGVYLEYVRVRGVERVKRTGPILHGAIATLITNSARAIAGAFALSRQEDKVVLVSSGGLGIGAEVMTVYNACSCAGQVGLSRVSFVAALCISSTNEVTDVGAGRSAGRQMPLTAQSSVARIVIITVIANGGGSTGSGGTVITELCAVMSA